MENSDPKPPRFPTPPNQKCNHIAITPLLYYNLLRSEEYAPYLVLRDQKPFLDMVKLPRGAFIPLCGDKVDGYILTTIINQAIPLLDGQYLEIRMRSETTKP